MFSYRVCESAAPTGLVRLRHLAEGQRLARVHVRQPPAGLFHGLQELEVRAVNADFRQRVLLLRLVSGHLLAPEIEPQTGRHALIVQIEYDSAVAILENELRIR